MPAKTYRIRFYGACFMDGESELSIVDFLIAAFNDKGAMFPAVPLGNTTYQVRNVLPAIDGNSVSGAFVRFRSDAPLVGNHNDQNEEVINLDGGRQFLEKNYFVISKEVGGAEVISYQVSLEGGHVAALGRYLSLLSVNKTCAFDDILTGSSLNDLFAGKLIKSIDFRVAKPRKKSYQPDPEDTWTKDALDFLDSTGGTTFRGTVGIKSPTKGLLADVLPKVSKLLSSDQTRMLRIKVSDAAEPIDLLAERVFQKIHVELDQNGHVVPDNLLTKIREAKASQQHHIDHYFGA